MSCLTISVPMRWRRSRPKPKSSSRLIAYAQIEKPVARPWKSPYFSWISTWTPAPRSASATAQPPTPPPTITTLSSSGIAHLGQQHCTRLPPAADGSLHQRRKRPAGMLARERERSERPLEGGRDLGPRRGGVGRADPGIVRPRGEERTLGLEVEVVAQALERGEPALGSRRDREPRQGGRRAGEGAHNRLRPVAVAGRGPCPVTLGHGHHGARRGRAPQRDEQL